MTKTEAGKIIYDTVVEITPSMADVITPETVFDKRLMGNDSPMMVMQALGLSVYFETKSHPLIDIVEAYRFFVEEVGFKAFLDRGREE